MTPTKTTPANEAPAPRTASVPTRRDGRIRRIAPIGIVALALLAVVAVGAFVVGGDDGSDGETADLGVQGDSGNVLAADAARLIRRADGIVAEIEIPTPAPGSYRYPTSDLVPPGFEPHPQIVSGASAAPEVFTAWLFAFNHPDRCTEGRCDFDDVGADSAARGGSYQIDGRIADGDRLVLAGGVRLGQVPVSGARLENPLGAEVHLAIAPHGRALSSPDRWRQLNEPVGNPDFWWAASFES